MKTILVVDDDLSVQSVLRTCLAIRGYHVLCVVNGSDAMQILRSTKVDLVILDMNMPILDGWSTAAAIRQSDVGSVPIIAHSCYTLPGDKTRAIQAGCDRFLTKPADLESIQTAIEELLAGQPL